MTIHVVTARFESDWRRARELVDAYAASLGIDLSFQNFEREIEQLDLQYGSPSGAFLIAEDEGNAIGCVALRKLDEGVGEIKRLYVAPAVRGRGVGRALAETVIEKGRELGYLRLRLDTLPSMRAAHALYLSLGFQPIAPYYFNPIEDSAFLELSLA